MQTIYIPMNSQPNNLDYSIWSPLPTKLEKLAFSLIWPIIIVNLIGTIFGFWYYMPQFSNEPFLMWIFVPDSPVATLFFSLSLVLWQLKKDSILVSTLAFIGCIKLGLWTSYCLILFFSSFSYLDPLMYHFLLWSHLAMVLQAFLILRYTSFSTNALIVGIFWYGLNDLVDYFIPIIGQPHHTWIPSEVINGVVSHSTPAHSLAAVGALIVTLIPIILLVKIIYFHQKN